MKRIGGLAGSEGAAERGGREVGGGEVSEALSCGVVGEADGREEEAGRWGA